MAKNNEKQTEQEVEEVVVEETAQVEPTEEVVVETEEASKPEKQSKPGTPAQKDKKQKQQDNKKAKKDKKPSKVGKKVKETVSELKKVNWPTFGQVCKKTGVVLAVVVIFAVVLFGIDRLLSWLFGLLTGI